MDNLYELISLQIKLYDRIVFVFVADFYSFLCESSFAMI